MYLDLHIFLLSYNIRTQSYNFLEVHILFREKKYVLGYYASCFLIITLTEMMERKVNVLINFYNKLIIDFFTYFI